MTTIELIEEVNKDMRSPIDESEFDVILKKVKGQENYQLIQNAILKYAKNKGVLMGYQAIVYRDVGLCSPETIKFGIFDTKREALKSAKEEAALLQGSREHMIGDSAWGIARPVHKGVRTKSDVHVGLKEANKKIGCVLWEEEIHLLADRMQPSEDFDKAIKAYIDECNEDSRAKGKSIRPYKKEK